MLDTHIRHWFFDFSLAIETVETVSNSINAMPIEIYDNVLLSEFCKHGSGFARHRLV